MVGKLDVGWNEKDSKAADFYRLDFCAVRYR
jgi:hypothetical protein